MGDKTIVMLVLTFNISFIPVSSELHKKREGPTIPHVVGRC